MSRTKQGAQKGVGNEVTEMISCPASVITISQCQSYVENGATLRVSTWTAYLHEYELRHRQLARQQEHVLEIDVNASQKLATNNLKRHHVLKLESPLPTSFPQPSPCPAPPIIGCLGNLSSRDMCMTLLPHFSSKLEINQLHEILCSRHGKIKK